MGIDPDTGAQGTLPTFADRLWKEYQYRHDLAWRVAFQLTGAVVLLAILPYAKPDVTAVLRVWVIPVPLVGVALTVFGIFMMKAELRRLDVVRTEYRILQEKELGIAVEGSGFTRRVMIYLGALLALQVVNLVIVYAVWLPRTGPG